MPKHLGLWAIPILLWSANSVLAQAITGADQRMDQVERRMDDMEKRHQAELKARDERIANLERQLKDKPTTDTTPTAADVDKVTSDILKDINSRNPITQTVRVPVSFNPDLAVVGNFQGNVSTNN